MTFFLEKKFDSLGFFSIMMAFFNESHLFDMVSSHANIKGRIIRLIIHRSQINCSEVVETTGDYRRLPETTGDYQRLPEINRD